MHAAWGSFTGSRVQHSARERIGGLKRALAKDPPCAVWEFAHLRQSNFPISLLNLETADPDDFASAIGTPFEVTAGDLAVPMELVEVRLLGHRRDGAIREPFALLFRAESGQILPQATYPVNHPELGGFDLFIVPVGRAAEGGVNYEAVFT